MKSVVQEVRNRLEKIELDVAFEAEILKEAQALFEASPFITTLATIDTNGLALSKYLRQKFGLGQKQYGLGKLLRVLKASHDDVEISDNGSEKFIDTDQFENQVGKFILIKGSKGWLAVKLAENGREFVEVIGLDNQAVQEKIISVPSIPKGRSKTTGFPLTMAQIILGSSVDSLEYYRFVPSDTQLRALLKYLHRNFRVSDQAKLVPFSHPGGNIDLISFKQHYDNFIIFRGEKGWAAFKPSEKALRPMVDAGNLPIKSNKPIPYIAVYSLNADNGEIKVEEFVATRGGRYDRPEKAGVQKETAADHLKKFVGEKDIKVYRLMERDPEEFANMPPEVFSGKGSRQLSTPASIQRRKVDVRKGKNQSEIDQLTNQVFSRLERLKPRFLDHCLAIKDIDDLPYPPIMKKASEDPEYYNKIWTSVVKDAMESIEFRNEIAAEIANYQKKYNDTRTSDDLIILKLVSSGKALPDFIKFLKKAICDFMSQ